MYGGNFLPFQLRIEKKKEKKKIIHIVPKLKNTTKYNCVLKCHVLGNGSILFYE